MSLPIGTALTATIRYTKAGALYDPSPLPTIVDARYPDGTVLAPLPALAHPAVGIFTATVFTALQATQTGTYDALIWTTDATVDCQGVSVEWPEVGISSITDLSAAGLADIWSYATRTLTQTAAQIASVLAGSTITIQRGDTLSASLTGITAYIGYSKLWFTAKEQTEDNDKHSIIQILLSSPADPADGLKVIAGQTATASDGSLTATNPALGDVTIAIAAEATRLLEPSNHYSYDIQALIGITVTTLASGSLIVSADVTRVVS